MIVVRQVHGLLDGGVDVLLVETIFDTLNAKVACVVRLHIFVTYYMHTGCTVRD